MPDRRMLVALWLRPTHRMQGSSPEVRVGSLGTALALTETIRKAYLSKFPRDWAKPQVLFVAPEYLFGHPTGPQPGLPRMARVLSYTPHPQTCQERHLDESQANQTLKRLKELSRKYPNFLIVPGTIAWYKRFKDLRDPHLASQIVQQARDRLGLQDGDPLSVPKRSAVPPAGDHSAPATADKLARLGSFQRIAQSPQPTPDELDRLEKARLCLNTAVVLYQGRTLLVYHKQGDFHEVLAQYDAARAYQVALPGRKNGVFELEGIRYGLEVCLDHALGALRLNPGPGLLPPHIHIVTSASVEIDVRNCVVADGGYVLNASCSQNDSGLWSYRSAPPSLVAQQVLPHVPQTAAGCPFRLYGIRLAA